MTRKVVFDRENVLEKAMLVFWQKGYSQTSLRDLITATGLGQSSLYNTFSNKEKFFLDCFLHYQHKISGRKEILTHATSTKQGLHDYFKQEIEIAYTDPLGCMITNTIIEDVSLPDSLKKELQTLFQASFQDLGEKIFNLLEKGKETGEISATISSEVQATLFVSLKQSINVISKTKISQEKISQMINTVIENL